MDIIMENYQRHCFSDKANFIAYKHADLKTNNKVDFDVQTK